MRLFIYNRRVGSPTDLAATHSLTVPRDLVEGTGEALRSLGDRGFEALVLWLGKVSDGVATVVEAFVPDQHPIRDETGVGYFVDGESLFALNVHLHREGLLLLAQVHSHPGEAYHSSADDRYAIVTTEGGYSLVAPDFGAAFAIPSCAIYRLEDGEWGPLPEREVGRQIRIS